MISTKTLQGIRRKDIAIRARRRSDVRITTKRYLGTTVIITTITRLDTEILIDSVKIDTGPSALGILPAMMMIRNILTREDIGESVRMPSNHRINLHLSTRKKERA